MPYGFGKSMSPDGIERGVMAAAAIIFFAFYGFDAISTAAEETRNPSRDLVIGIIGSLAICTLVYVLVAAAAIGAMPFTRFADGPEPLALILRQMGREPVARVVAIAAVIALPTVLLGFLYGQSRIFLAMARDGFLPASLAKLSSRGTPVRVTTMTAVIVAILAGILPISEIAALANAGTLIAFAAVGTCLIVLRKREPGAHRPFRVPAGILVGVLTIGGCLYLFASLPNKTLLACLGWNVLVPCSSCSMVAAAPPDARLLDQAGELPFIGLQPCNPPITDGRMIAFTRTAAAVGALLRFPLPPRTPSSLQWLPNRSSPCFTAAPR